MSIVSKSYTANGSTKIFQSDFKVLSEQHIQVLVDGVVVSKSDYDTINNAAVFDIAPASGSIVIVKVGTTPDDLLTSTTNIDTVSTNIDAINTVENNLDAINTTASNISAITTAATNSANIESVSNISGSIQVLKDNINNINTTATNIGSVNIAANSIGNVNLTAGSIDNVNNVGNNILDVNTVADDITNVNTISGNITNVNTVASHSNTITGIATQVLPNINEILLADNNAAIATTKASEAASSASSASGYATAAANSAAAASSSASSASTSATTATTQAGIATTQAGIATTQATNASTSATNAATSETNSATSELNASNSEAAAQGYASDAQAASVNASGYATSASNSASAAATSESNASTSETNAANSASSASTSASNAATSESNASSSASAAASSVTSASSYASSASTSATQASNSATQAASSASSASQIVLGQSTGRANIKPVLNLDFANQKRLDSRVDFTRTSTATYYDGKKQVKAEENLLKYSEDFSNGAWAKDDTSATFNEIAPDGRLTAMLFNFDHQYSDFRQSNIALTAGATYTYSIWIKGHTTSPTRLYVLDNSGANIQEFTITNEWARYTFSLTASSTATGVVIQCRDTNGFGSAYFAYPQLEQRDFATAYTPTTDKPITNYIPVLSTAQANEPRFDYDLETKECKGLLIEEQRTNLFGNSVNMAVNQTRTDIRKYAPIIAPNGFQDGLKLYKSTDNNYSMISTGVPFTTGSTYTVSFFAKSGGYNFVYSRCSGVGNDDGIVVDLENGVITKQDNDLINSKIENYGNGWYRCSYSAVASKTGTTLTPYLFVSNTDSFGVNLNPVFVGNNYDGIYVFGLQVEQGSFATSYIPTNGSQVTRTADNCFISGENFSSFYNPSEGSFFADFDFDFTLNNTPKYVLFSSSNARFMYANANVNNNLNFYNGHYIDSSALKDGKNKAISRYTTDTITVSTDSASTITPGINQDNTNIKNVTYLSIGSWTGGVNSLNGHIRKVAYYDKALTDTELQLLTQG